jgi:glycosyltransferase involved in cell wall biosynthesis
MIPNMSKIDEFFERPKNKEAAIEFGIDLNKFNAIHFGTMGLANNLDYIIDAAIDLKKKNVKHIDILFLGGGRTEEKLKQRCKDEALSNIKFLGRHPMKIVSEIVNISDVSIVTFANLPILYTNSPNKLFDSLSAAKPIIVNSAGWTKQMVEDNNCGLFADPEAPEALADALIKLSLSPEILQTMSKNSRDLAETVYDKTILCKAFHNLIHSFDKTRIGEMANKEQKQLSEN